jgi:hypothetical protein
MSTYGPFHRLGTPGGPGCRVTMIPVQGKAPDGAIIDGSLLDAGAEAPEIELLRTVASGLGVIWGHDEFGWWAAVPSSPTSKFAVASSSPTRQSLFREDDNGARFLIDHFASLDEAERRAAELAHGGHKQHYFIELATDEQTTLADTI